MAKGQLPYKFFACFSFLLLLFLVLADYGRPTLEVFKTPPSSQDLFNTEYFYFIICCLIRFLSSQVFSREKQQVARVIPAVQESHHLSLSLSRQLFIIRIIGDIPNTRYLDTGIIFIRHPCIPLQMAALETPPHQTSHFPLTYKQNNHFFLI